MTPAVAVITLPFGRRSCILCYDILKAGQKKTYWGWRQALA